MKLCLEDPKQTLPNDIEDFEETFTVLCEKLEKIMKDLYSTIATCVDPSTKKPVHDEQAMKVVLDCLRMGSSVSMIDYKPVSYEEVVREYKNPERDAPTNKDHYPSATHCDTGFLTMIMCSDVPALQIKDRFVRSFSKKNFKFNNFLQNHW